MSTFFKVAQRNITFPHPKGGSTLTANQLFKLKKNDLVNLAKQLHGQLPKADATKLFSFESASLTKAEEDRLIQFQAVKEVVEFKHSQEMDAVNAAKKKELNDAKRQMILAEMQKREGESIGKLTTEQLQAELAKL